MLGFPSCREVAEQLSEDIDNPLAGGQWLKSKLHLLICAYCRRYGEQIRLSAATIKHLDKGRVANPEMEASVIEAFKSCHGKKKKKSCYRQHTHTKALA